MEWIFEKFPLSISMISVLSSSVLVLSNSSSNSLLDSEKLLIKFNGFLNSCAIPAVSCPSEASFLTSPISFEHCENRREFSLIFDWHIPVPLLVVELIGSKIRPGIDNIRQHQMQFRGKSGAESII